MQCTAEQIEEKRRIAQAKLAKRTQNSISPLKSSEVQQDVKKWNFKSPVRSPFRTSVSSTKAQATKPYDKPKQAVQFHGKDSVQLKCQLVSEDRFLVEMSSFHTPAIEIFKTIPTRNYDPKTRIWNFHMVDYELLLSKLVPLQPNIVLERLPKFVVNLLKRPKSDYSNIDLSKIDPELGSTLMRFQQEGVIFGIEKNGRCLIADDMGLGKTFQALGIASYYREDWPLLIVTTASMKNVWEETIHNYVPSVPLMKVQYMISTRDYIGEAEVLIVSYDLMSRGVDLLMEKNFGVIIIDESHTLKNFKAKCTKSATLLAKRAKRVILLSGTPALSRPSELYSQLALIDDKFFGNFFEYSKRYCDGKSTNFGWDASGKSNLQELEIVLSRKFMIRRTKEDVLKALPNKTQEVVTLDVNLEQFSDKERLCLNSLSERYNSSVVKGAEKHSLLLTFFAETAKIKIPSVCSYILQILETTNKFLVFAHHQVMLDAISNVLRKKDKKFIRIDGATTGDQRKYFVDKFQTDDNYICAVLSITAANAGITLTAAQLVLFAELHWNPSILSQAESRAHRIGQSNPVVVRYLLAPKTADDSIWPMLQEKQKILGEAGLSKDSFNNVVIKKQERTTDDTLTEGLNISRTVANTLDITSYFKDMAESDDSFTINKNDECSKTEVGNSVNSELDFFNDGFDDVLCSIDI